MAPEPSIEQRLIQMLSGLVANTKLGNIPWESTDDPEAFIYSTARSSAIIDTEASQKPRTYWLKVLNGQGAVVGVLERDAEHTDFTDASFDDMKELHELARRKALGADDAIDSILQGLREMPPF